MWKQISEEVSATAAQVAAALIHVGGPGIPGRTALVWANELAITLARQASEGEPVPIVFPGGATAEATVQAWDPRTGLTLLRVPGVVAPSRNPAPQPPLGTLVLTVAFPSPQGPEARLDVVRFSGGPSEWGRGVALEGVFQTDGVAFPGFTGAAVVDHQGRLAGLVADNQPGNGGFVVPVTDLARMVERLVSSGSPRQPWLGVSTRPGGGQGLVLLGVDPESPAEAAGWKSGDLLVSLGGTPLKSPEDLVRVLAGLTPGGEVKARLLRQGEVLDQPVVPGER